jgi:low temperature requirement protein LtrA
MEAVGERAPVTTLELFFDLVFVFALTQVTTLMAQGETVTLVAVARGVLILCVLWWCWVGYAWLCNVVRADEGLARVAMFVAMGGMFVAAVTIPEAFDDFPGGLYGPAVFAVCYFVVRAMHIFMFWLASREDPVLRHQVLRWVPSVLAGTLLLLAASQTTGTAQTLLWAR